MMRLVRRRLKEKQKQLFRIITTASFLYSNKRYIEMEMTFIYKIYDYILAAYTRYVDMIYINKILK